MKCYEGCILSVDREDRVCHYLVEDAGRIVYTGDTLPQQYARAERISLGDQALVPAFADTHQHFASYSTFRAGLNVMDAESNEQISRMIRDFAAHSRGKTLIAFGTYPNPLRGTLNPENWGLVEIDDGTFYIAEYLGIMEREGRTEEQTEIVRQFAEWFGSAETQIAWSEEFDSYPCNQDAAAELFDETPAIYTIKNFALNEVEGYPPL